MSSEYDYSGLYNNTPGGGQNPVLANPEPFVFNTSVKKVDGGRA